MFVIFTIFITHLCSTCIWSYLFIWAAQTQQHFKVFSAQILLAPGVYEDYLYQLPAYTVLSQSLYRLNQDIRHFVICTLFEFITGYCAYKHSTRIPLLLLFSYLFLRAAQTQQHFKVYFAQVISVLGVYEDYLYRLPAHTVPSQSFHRLNRI